MPSTASTSGAANWRSVNVCGPGRLAGHVEPLESEATQQVGILDPPGHCGGTQHVLRAARVPLHPERAVPGLYLGHHHATLQAQGAALAAHSRLNTPGAEDGYSRSSPPGSSNTIW